MVKAKSWSLYTTPDYQENGYKQTTWRVEIGYKFYSILDKIFRARS